MFENLYKVFFSIKFVNTDIITSIGCITETGESFYFERSSYYDDGIQTNVNFDIRKEDMNVVGYGTYPHLKNEFHQWINQIYQKYNKKILFVSNWFNDSALMYKLLGGMFEFPDYVCGFIWDISHDIAYYLKISPDEVYDISLEEFIEKYRETPLEKDNDYENTDTLWDAKVIKEVFNIIHKK